MIKYNDDTINKWYHDGELIKVYYHDAVVFYKFDSEQGGYKVCYAVVDDITQYQETEFEDVYDKATEKWYKLNNLNQYEQYGVYGSGRNITYYDGKLTIDSGYEYEWNGSSWVNLGEVSGSSKTSDFKIGDIKERVTTGVSNGDYLLFSYYKHSDISKPENIMSYNPSNNYLSNLSGYGITSIDSTTIIDPSIWLLESTASANTFYIKSIKNNMYWGYQNTQTSRSLNLVDSSSSQKAPVLITPSCKENCYGFVEKKSNVSNGYGGYGLNQLNSHTYQLNWLNSSSSNNPCTFFTTDGNADFIIYKMNASDAEYPKYYSEKSEPLDNLTFNTMAEAQAYAEANCVYVGLKATINGDKYVFSGDSQSGYEWVHKPSRLPDGYTEVEYIENTSTAYINTNIQVYSSTTNSFEVEAKLIAARHDSQTYQNVFSCMSEDGEPYQGFTYRYKSSSLVGTSIPNGQNTFTIVNNEDSTQTVTVTSSSSQRTYTHTYPLTLFCGLNSSRSPFRWTNSKFYYCKIKMNDELVRDFVPAKRDSDDKYGMYDLTTDTFYLSPNNVDFSGGDPV